GLFLLPDAEGAPRRDALFRHRAGGKSPAGAGLRRFARRDRPGAAAAGAAAARIPRRGPAVPVAAVPCVFVGAAVRHPDGGGAALPGGPLYGYLRSPPSGTLCWPACSGASRRWRSAVAATATPSRAWP